MSTFLDLSSELAGYLPGLSPFLADSFVNRAWTDVCNRRLWNWLQQDAAVACPAQITAGTVSITRGSATVNCDAAASAALVAQEATAFPTVTNLQIRFGQSSPAVGQVYNITGYNAANPAAVVLTLDRVVFEATNAASGYQCYRCYVVPPVSAGSFMRWESFTDMVNGWRLRKDRTSAYFDASDPQRQAQGLAYNVGSYEVNRVADPITGATAPNSNQSAGVPNYELWPHPTGGQTFYVRMRVKGQPFVQPTDGPSQYTNLVDDQLIIQRALYMYAYPWAKANAGHFPTMKGVNWSELIVASRNSYVTDLMPTAIRMDNDQGLQDVWNRGHGLRQRWGDRLRGSQGFPIDTNFIQSHLLNI